MGSGYECSRHYHHRLSSSSVWLHSACGMTQAAKSSKKFLLNRKCLTSLMLFSCFLSTCRNRDQSFSVIQPAYNTCLIQRDVTHVRSPWAKSIDASIAACKSP